MGRNHQNKKKLKAEKAKVKLKQTKTKFLPKGLNVTKTAFKIKPIVLPEQLKSKSAGDILSKRKLNIADLLSRLNHYNENVKSSACEELSELINLTKEGMIHQHLAHICLAVSTLMQDRERKVRRGAVKVINAILEQVSNEKLQPFFNYFSTNLRCAMTNIDKNVQEDSLAVLDCFIKHNSDLIKQNSEKILPDFFTLISKLRSDSSLERTVTVNLGSRMTSVTWRIKVLSRLHAVLNMVLFDSSNNNLENRSALSSVTHEVTSENIFPLYKENFQKNLDFHVFNKFSNPQNSSDTNRNAEILNKHIITLVPLLYETWLEVVPDRRISKSSSGKKYGQFFSDLKKSLDYKNQYKDESTTLSEEAATVLTCIVNTLYLLWQYVKQFGNEFITMKTVFLSEDGKKFFKHLFSNFPYSQSGGRKQNRQKANARVKIFDVNDDPKCVQENLLLCLIYGKLCVNFLQHNVKNELESITSYITKILLTTTCTDVKNIKYLVEFLEECFGKNSHKWKNRGVDLDGLLENTIWFYNHGKLNDQNKLKIFNILSDVVDSNYRTEKYTEWLTTLPEILCQPKVSDIQVNSLLQLSKKNGTGFHEAVFMSLPKILANLTNIRIMLTSKKAASNDEEVAKRNLVNMFYYLPKFGAEEKMVIHEFIVQNSDSECCYYLQQVLELRRGFKNEEIF